MDVCDDARLATVAKALSGKAQEAGVAATISAGIWPGVDQLMAVEVRPCVRSVNFAAVNFLSICTTVGVCMLAT